MELPLRQPIGRKLGHEVMNSTWAFAKLSCADAELMVRVGCCSKAVVAESRAMGMGWELKKWRAFPP